MLKIKEKILNKLDVQRVGYGTQTYNDVALTLNKEETLELLNHIEQIEKEIQELKEKNLKLSIENHNSKIVEEMNKTVVENKNKQLLKATELNITYIDKIIMLKKAIKILKGKLVPILLLQEVDTLEEYNEGLDDCDEYRLTQEEFDLLKKVFESVGGSDE